MKKRGKRKIDEFRKKLMIPKYEMAECSEYKVKSNIGKIFANENILGEYSLKFMKLILIFMSIKKKIQANKNGRDYILFRIDV